MFWTNYHNHCSYCDGKESIENHVKAAIQQGVTCIGFTSHAPVPFVNLWSLKKRDINKYLNEVDQAKTKYQGQIEIYKSLEIDYIPNIVGPNDPEITRLHLDYTLGSVHFVGQFDNEEHWEIDGTQARFRKGLHQIYDNNIRYAVTQYFKLIRRMVRESCPDIIGHLDKIKMNNQNMWDENAGWYKNELLNTLEEIRSTKAIIEVNTRSIYKKISHDPYPSLEILKHILKMQIPVHINSDAHRPGEITAGFPEIYTALTSIGFKKAMILHKNEWVYAKLDKKGLKM